MIYIVSGLERSGTSLMMQILEKGGFPVVYDKKRKADKNNPKGYYELFGGKIISRLEEDKVDLSEYEDKAIKVTSIGIYHLPEDFEYMIFWMERDFEELARSREKMTKGVMLNPRELRRLNDDIKIYMSGKKFIKFHTFRYNKILADPERKIYRLGKFVEIDLKKAVKAVDPKLYRNKI